MKKTLELIGLIALATLLLLAGWFIYKTLQPAEVSPTETSEDLQKTAAEKAAESAVEQIPDLNPINKTNPFSGSYQNPFKQ